VTTLDTYRSNQKVVLISANGNQGNHQERECA
jgi:hypothetical protein